MTPDARTWSIPLKWRLLAIWYVVLGRPVAFRVNVHHERIGIVAGDRALILGCSISSCEIGVHAGPLPAELLQ